MRDTGLWQRIIDRLVREAGDGMIADAEEAFRDIRAAERAEVAAAIRGGEGYEALWERTPSR
jgi:hypothetical protein